jgi:hypothetical protein
LRQDQILIRAETLSQADNTILIFLNLGVVQIASHSVMIPQGISLAQATPKTEDLTSMICVGVILTIKYEYTNLH